MSQTAVEMTNRGAMKNTTASSRPGLAAIAVALAWVLAFGVGSARASVAFTPSVFAAGDLFGARQMAIGDFNGDGHPDLAVPDQTDRVVSVLLGSAGGAFAPPVEYPGGGFPLAVAVGDLNGDGHPDLVTADGTGVAVLRGFANGSFGPPSTFPGGSELVAVGVGDFNGDGHLDVAAADGAGSAVVVMLGHGDGTLGPAVSLPAGVDANSVTVSDLNGDGHLDLALADLVSPGRVSVLLGRGDGTFKAMVSYPTGGVANSVAVGDFTGDGKLDLAVATGSNSDHPIGDLVVLAGVGDGTFGTATHYPAGGNPNAVVAGDFNGDGVADVAVTNVTRDNPSRVSVLLGTPGGGLGAPSGFLVREGLDRFGSNPVALASGDFNGDGHLDLAAANNVEDVSVLLNTAASLDTQEIPFQLTQDHVDGSRHTVTLTNLGSAALSVASVRLAGANAASFLTSFDNCSGRSLAAGGSCTIAVRFRPLGTGPMNATLQFADSGVGSPQAVLLTGTGTPGPWLQMSTGALKFGHVRVGTTATPQTVTLTNVGSATLTVASITVSGANPGQFTAFSETCTSGALLPGQSCSATIAFRATSGGTKSAQLTIVDNAPGTPHQVGLAGTGI